MEKRKIVIIGAGPGGLRAAEEAARLKEDVLVLEKEKEPGKKVCAGGTTAKIVRDFPFVAESIERASRRFRIEANGQVAYFKEKQPFFFSINRTALALCQEHRARQAGAEIRRGERVVAIKPGYVQTARGDQIAYDYLIGADGPRSLVRQHLVIPCHFRGQAINFKVPSESPEPVIFLNTRHWGHAYAWIFPHRGYTSLGTGVTSHTHHAAEMITRIKQLGLARHLPMERGTLETDLINCDYRGYRFQKNIFLIGEAAGLISGLTGEGIYNALVMGQEVARLIAHRQTQSSAIHELVSSKRTQEHFITLYRVCPPLLSLGYHWLPFLIKRRRWAYHRLLKAIAY